MRLDRWISQLIDDVSKSFKTKASHVDDKSIDYIREKFFPDPKQIFKKEKVQLRRFTPPTKEVRAILQKK